MTREQVDQLLNSEYQGLLRLLRRKARDPQLAADLLNDAVVVTLKHLQSGRLSDPARLAGYVFEVAMNLLRNHWRKHSERSDKRADVDGLADAAEAEPVENEWGKRVRQLLLELPVERDRQLLKRFYLDEEDKEVICRELGVAPLHFDKIIFRAKRRMQSLLESQGLRKQDFFSVLLCGLAA